MPYMGGTSFWSIYNVFCDHNLYFKTLCSWNLLVTVEQFDIFRFEVVYCREKKIFGLKYNFAIKHVIWHIIMTRTIHRTKI